MKLNINWTEADWIRFTFTFTHLSDAFIQSDLQLHSGYTFSLVRVFPGNRTHNLLRSWRNALPLSHTGTYAECSVLCNKEHRHYMLKCWRWRMCVSVKYKRVEKLAIRCAEPTSQTHTQTHTVLQRRLCFCISTTLESPHERGRLIA